MKPSLLLVLCLLVASVCLPIRAQTPAPTLIPFQGRLTDQAGTPYTNGQFSVVFQLYDQAVGGVLLWHERHEKVGVINGMVNVFLGSISPLGAVNFSTTRYLGVTVDGDNNPNTPDPEMVPRQMMIPAFWARNADNANKLGTFGWPDLLAGGATNPVSGKIDGTKLLAGSITGTHLGPGSVGASHIANQSVTATHLQDGSLGFSKLTPRTVAQSVDLGGVALSNDSGASQQSGVEVDNNNTPVGVEATIRTSGRPVFIGLTSGKEGVQAYLRAIGPLDNSSPSPGIVLRWYRGNQMIAEFSGAVGQVTHRSTFHLPLGAYATLDFPPPGQHTYTIRVGNNGATGQVIEIHHIRLAAFEL